MELMLHIGIDTVKLDGQGFDVFVKEGGSFKKGDRLMAFDLDYIKEHAVSEACIVIFTAMEEGTAVKVIEEKEVRALEHVADLIG